MGFLDRDADDVEGSDRLVRDPLALEQRAHGTQPIAEHRRLLELLPARGLLHTLLELPLDVAIAARQEADYRVDVLAVGLLADVADAWRLAALDEVVEARAAGGAAGFRPLTGAVGKQPPEQVERLAHPLGARERPEVDTVVAVALPREIDAR